MENMKKPTDPLEKYIIEKFREMGIQALPLKGKKLPNRARRRLQGRERE